MKKRLKNIVNGFFISFEGIEGSGKSTQAKLLYEALKKRGIHVMLTFEPGGTKIGERIREILLVGPEHAGMVPLTELFLFSAARYQHVHELIMPSLKKGMVVITDRFIDSTMAYQGAGRGIALKTIESINRIATQGLKPHMTFLLDLPAESGIERTGQFFLWSGAEIVAREQKADRFEFEKIAFHRKVRQGYLYLREREPERIILFDATRPVEELHKEIVKIVLQRLTKRVPQIISHNGVRTPSETYYLT
ncbi:MAG: dTMP kinase [Thermodesulfovibrionia bacterium]|nr:dTMP kinase [Thermodesulfovibrionia bacterium]